MATAKKATAKKTAAKKAPAKKTAAKKASPTPARKSASRRALDGSTPPPAEREARAAKGEERSATNTAPAVKRVPDAVDLLVDDHLAAAACFEKYEKLADAEAPAEERERLARTVCRMLTVHAQIEEEIFYPAAREAGIDSDLLDEADVEHQSAKDLIAQIEGASPDDDKYDAKVTVLGEYIEHHVVEEQSEMFAKCRRSGMDLVALRERLEARKAELMPEEAEADDGEEPGLLSKMTGKLLGR